MPKRYEHKLNTKLQTNADKNNLRNSSFTFEIIEENASNKLGLIMTGIGDDYFSADVLFLVEP